MSLTTKQAKGNSFNRQNVACPVIHLQSNSLHFLHVFYFLKRLREYNILPRNPKMIDHRQTMIVTLSFYDALILRL